MLVGTLAISGVPFFSGFYSKDAILAAAMARVMQSPEHFLLFLLPAVGAVLTAFYMFRMWFLVFAGEPRGFPTRAEAVHAHVTTRSTPWTTPTAMAIDRNPAAHAHESEPIMTWPLIILAVLQHLRRLDALVRLPSPWARRPWSICSNTASRTGRRSSISPS